MPNGDQPVEAEGQEAAGPQGAFQQHYQPATVVVSGSQNTVMVGQQGPVAQQHLALPLRLASHNFWYWIIHFLIGLAAALVVWFFTSLLLSH